ncbi:MAG TPA: VOC family protein [Albitalea sp.]|uniref:VOC family protein n=1 Tax=Piscinibacter sp. TaxID=1903157 RepID=UPI002ED4B27F
MNETIHSTLNHMSFPSREADAAARFFERYLGFTISPMGTSRVLKKDGLDIVIEDASGREVNWPHNFHIGVELPTVEAVHELRALLVSQGEKMETAVLGHARGSRFFCWVPGGMMLEVNTRADANDQYRTTFARQSQ